MKINHLINRIVFYPYGILKAMYLLKKKGAGDLVNKKRFKNVIIEDVVCTRRKSLINDHTPLLLNCIINNFILGSYSYRVRNSIVQNTTIGKFCSIFNDIFIGLGKHQVQHFSTFPFYIKEKIFSLI